MRTVYKLQIVAIIFYVSIAADLKWLTCIIFAVLALKYLILRKEIDDFVDNWCDYSKDRETSI